MHFRIVIGQMCEKAAGVVCGDILPEHLRVCFIIWVGVGAGVRCAVHLAVDGRAFKVLTKNCDIPSLCLFPRHPTTTIAPQCREAQQGFFLCVGSV